MWQKKNSLKDFRVFFTSNYIRKANIVNYRSNCSHFFKILIFLLELLSYLIYSIITMVIWPGLWIFKKNGTNHRWSFFRQIAPQNCSNFQCELHIGWNTADGNHFFKPLSDFPFRTAVVSMLWRVIWPGFLILDKNDTIRQLSISFCQIDVEISKATLECCNVIELRQIV